MHIVEPEDDVTVVLSSKTEMKHLNNADNLDETFVLPASVLTKKLLPSFPIKDLSDKENKENMEVNKKDSLTIKPGKFTSMGAELLHAISKRRVSYGPVAQATNPLLPTPSSPLPSECLPSVKKTKMAAPVEGPTLSSELEEAVYRRRLQMERNEAEMNQKEGIQRSRKSLGSGRLSVGAGLVKAINVRKELQQQQEAGSDILEGRKSGGKSPRLSLNSSLKQVRLLSSFLFTYTPFSS